MPTQPESDEMKGFVQGALEKITEIMGKLEGLNNFIEDHENCVDRFEIMQRDGFRCRLCNRAASNTVKLVVRETAGRAGGISYATICKDCISFSH